MKTFLSIVMLLAGSITVASAGANSHAEVSDGVAKEMGELMAQMVKIADVKGAKAFAAKVPATEAKLKALLKAAQALPAPTKEEKLDFSRKMKAAEEKAAPAIMQMMMGLAQNPDAEAIGEILAGAMENGDSDQVGADLEALYALEEDANDANEGKVEPAPVKPLIE